MADLFDTIGQLRRELEAIKKAISLLEKVELEPIGKERRSMTPEERQRASERMKKSWAQRRARERGASKQQ